MHHLWYDMLQSEPSSKIYPPLPWWNPCAFVSLANQW